ncbi:MAG TPA: ABC transporter permease [Streptosporangiaceae bacterium]|nr:ABC transporter permease [Streptosporangiaceae bacterium]
MAVAAAPAERAISGRKEHPLAALAARRLGVGLVTLFVVSVIVFLATEVLPGNAAFAVLGRSANPVRLHALERQLHLNQGLLAQYWTWLSGLFTGKLGASLANGQPVWGLIEPRLINSAVLVFATGVIGTVVGVALGAIAALRKDSWFDHTCSVAALTVTSLPEFVVAITLVILFSTVVSHLLPAVSLLPPGTYAWSQPELLILPVATLVIVIVPYIFRMMRAAMIEALESDYVEMARLKGVPEWQIVLVHALPNAIAPTIQVIGLNFLYLAGGVVVVEYVFNFPGIGQELVFAVDNRDIPVIQFIVVVLAAFYVCVNIVSDVIALLATPRRRIPRQ